MRSQNLNFIVVDDSKLDCFIAEKMIFNAGFGRNVKSFLNGAVALQYIQANIVSDTEEKSILIVDIQMPVMNGFEFIEAFEMLPKSIQNNYRVFVLTSSVNLNDINHAVSYKTVEDILSKPLTTRKILDIFG